MNTYSPDKIRNVAIVGHVGAGKTTLVEQMLFASGSVDRLGSVDQGNSHSDFDAQEIRRKISLGVSVFPIEWKGHKINLIDVPGFPDFIGDLYGVAKVVEAMIVVAPAQAALDVGFDNAWEIAESEGLCRMIFVNKLERDNADYSGLMKALDERFGNRVVPLQVPIGSQAAFNGVLDLVDMKVHGGSGREESVGEAPSEIAQDVQKARDQMMDSAAEGDDALMEKYLEGEKLSEEEVVHGLEVGVAQGKVFPVLVGSAASGIGIASLLDRIVGAVPSPAEKLKHFGGDEIKPDPAAPMSAFVFKTTADPYVGRINYIRVMTGTLKPDSPIKNSGKGDSERIGSLFFPKGKEQLQATAVGAGDLAAISKLQHTGTGDTLCDAKASIEYPGIQFPEPIYRLAIHAKTKADEDKLGTALSRIADEDPTFMGRRDADSGEEIIEGMGDMHLDVSIEKLREKFGVHVETSEATVPYRETIRASSKAQGKFKRQTGGRGQYGDCWLELEPLPRGSGFEFGERIVGGSIPKNFIPAIEKGIREVLSRGFLAGYPVVDVKATVYDGSYHDVDSSENAFKQAGALAFRNAAGEAKPTILEPILVVEVDVPEEYTGDVMGDLNTRRGRPLGMEIVAARKQRIRAEVPMATMSKYALDLRSITKGRGRFRAEFAHYEELPSNEQQALIGEHQKKKAEESEG
ncbi:MAG TPA: elongation factor G [Fimbriimonadales bacterium]|nr:elongation factor G [Fimbriimonadales bacterium]